MRARREYQSADKQLLVYLGILIVLGLVALISASAPVGLAKFNDTYWFVKRQILFGLIPGIFLFLIFTKRDYHFIERTSYLWYGFALVLLVLVFIPGIGTVINGSRSWLSFSHFNIQPSEFAKLGLIIMTAYLLSRRSVSWDNWQISVLPILAWLSPALILVLLQPDVGTLSIMVVIICAQFLLAGVPYRYLVIFGAMGAAAFAALILAAPYRWERINTFLHPELDPQGVGYHMNQAFLAVGSGGFWGLGYGHSRQKFQYLPEVSADSIYAVVAEENGFLIAAGLVALIVLIGWRGFKIARAAPDDFGRLLVVGVTVWFLWQSFLNVGAMVGVFPLTGVPLPLVSHGGSAVVALLIGFGLVHSVSRFSRSTV